jgi:hypothetical protein
MIRREPAKYDRMRQAAKSYIRADYSWKDALFDLLGLETEKKRDPFSSGPLPFTIRTQTGTSEKRGQHSADTPLQSCDPPR